MGLRGINLPNPHIHKKNTSKLTFTILAKITEILAASALFRSSIQNLQRVYAENRPQHFCCWLATGITKSYTENCIVFATTGHARFEHARVLNNKMRAIQGFGIC